MHLWKNDPGTKPFADLKNKSRNELKHLIAGQPIEFDLETEAGRLLARAVENYRSLFGMETPKMREFQRNRLRAFRLHGV
jgi:cold shock CspA family protein